MKLTYYGHSTCLVETESHRLLFDPFLTDNPLASITAEEVICDYILLTHGHADHIADAAAIAKRCKATIIAVFELATYMGNQGIEVHPMHIGGQFDFPFGEIKLTIAHHGSGFFEEDGKITYLGNPAGILLRAENKVFYHAGDTGLFYDMNLIGDMYPIDLALLPIGGNFTMGIEDACRAVTFLKPKRVVPIHYNTWPIIEADSKLFAKKTPAPATAMILEPGQSLDF